MPFDIPTAVEALREAHKAGRLAHAFLVTGGTKEDRANLVLGAVETLLARQANSLQEVECENVTVLRPEAKSRVLKVEAVREMEKRFHRSSGGALRVGVLVDVDRMKEEAANAFLKTLEEPPRGVLLFLLTGKPESLLPTIRSRCLGIRLAQPPPPGLGDEGGERLRAALASHFEQAETLGTAMSLGGVFQTLLKEEKQRGEAESKAQYKEEVALYQKTSEGDYLKTREEHHKARVAAAYLLRREELLGMMLAWLGDVLRQKTGLPGSALNYPDDAKTTARIAGNLTEGEIVRRLDALGELSSLFETNASEALAIEVTFLEAFTEPTHGAVA